MAHKSHSIPSYCYVLRDGYPVAEDFPLNAIPLSVDECYSISTARRVQLFTDRICNSFDGLAIDLLTIASTVFIADCYSLRAPKTSNAHGWRRSIELTIPVQERDLWSGEAVQHALQSALNFVTGDTWTFHFVAHSGIRRDERLFLPLNQGSRICLFSEGLDSFCGLAYQLSSDQSAQFTAITASIQNQRVMRAKKVIKELNKQYENRVCQVAVPFQKRSVTWHHHADAHQRSRSFLLLCIAGVAALLSGSHQVEVYENGVEAFNFPFEEGLREAQVSRAMHPLFLSLMTAFMSVLTSSDFRFLEPFLFHTKRDMVAMLKDGPIRNLVEQTVSCMHFPSREKGPKQCGTCENCILRRVALFNAACTNECYRQHFLHPVSCDFIHMKMQMFQIQNVLRQTDPISELLKASGLSRIYRDQLLNAATQISGLPPSKVGENLRDLYARHLEQWAAYISSAEEGNTTSTVHAQTLIYPDKQIDNRGNV